MRGVAGRRGSPTIACRVTRSPTRRRALRQRAALGGRRGGAAPRSSGDAREAILAGKAESGAIAAAEVAELAAELARPSLRRVINATGVVLHTNLGRAPLADAARAAIDEVARGYSNLEYDLGKGERGSRHDHLRALLRELTGAEDAIVVQQQRGRDACSGLAALATGQGDRRVARRADRDRRLVPAARDPRAVARHGSSRSARRTRRTRATTRTRSVRTTGLLLKVHRSNFAIVGFTAEVTPEQVVAIGRARGVATMIDLGSGMLVDRATQREWGLPDEPTVAECGRERRRPRHVLGRQAARRPAGRHRGRQGGRGRGGAQAPADARAAARQAHARRARRDARAVSRWQRRGCAGGAHDRADSRGAPRGCAAPRRSDRRGRRPDDRRSRAARRRSAAARCRPPSCRRGR